MRYVAPIISVVAGILSGTASAQTVEQLKQELAAKKAEIARLPT
jgi:hypothetical protein